MSSLYAFLGGLSLEEVYRHYVLDVCAVHSQPLSETLIDGLRSIFLHMSFVHLTSNIIIFYVFGARIEEHLGHLRFLAFYLLVGFGGHLGHLFFDGGLCSEPQYMVGSSGAISGIIGAFLFLFPTARIQSKIVILKVFGYDVNVPAWVYLIYWFFLAILQSGGLGRAADQCTLGTRRRLHHWAGADISLFLLHRTAAHAAIRARGMPRWTGLACAKPRPCDNV